MEKLELKHIVGYLPYGLELQIIDTTDLRIGEKCNLIGINNMHKNIELRTSWGTLNSDQVLPLLRPLSDLTKEIEVNGEKFVPAEKIAIHLFDEDVRNIILNGEINGIPFWVIQKLYEWHFDVYELIKKGLAIDLNIIKNGIQ